MRSTSPARPGHASPRRHGDEPYRPVASSLKFGVEHIDAITQSHERCAALGVSRIERPDLTPLGPAELGLARERNRRLHDQAAPVMEMLYGQIVNSQNMVVLTDATGTVLHSIGDDDFLARAHKVALQPGVNWSEQTKGTNAIGTALIEEVPTLVHADEHYLHANHFLTCSAAPILDPRGNMLGVLDVSGDQRSYHPHTMALVKMSARMIENRWLADDDRHVMRLHFHSRPGFIGTLMEGILALGADGRIVGANRGALEQLGMSGAALRMHSLNTLLGTHIGTLVDHFRTPLAKALALTLADGRQVHVQARFNWPAWTHLSEPGEAPRLPLGDGATTAAPAPPTAALDSLCTGCTLIDQVVGKVRRVIDRDIPILILGETGTGKELLARAIHADSARATRPFVTVNCAAVDAHLIEAQLLACPDGGTLFLDEIGDLPLAQQAQLLRVLQHRRVTPAAGGAGESMAVAVIGATQRRLRERVAAQSFREDLYYRLNGLAVRLPPLRERSDLMVLVNRILDRESSKRQLRLAPDVENLFKSCAWPGNVRQLFQVLRTACAMADGDSVITRRHLPDGFPDDTLPAAAPVRAPSLEDLELGAIRRAVEEAEGNISQASRRLGVSRNTIYRKLRWNRPPP